MCKISIIVPVYNVENYLDRCIKSILNQKFKDFEVILVDDGSTDGSAKICDYYKRLDYRVLVIHKDNRGASSARNAGLDIAKGEYIGFVDGDDYIHEDMYYELYQSIIKNNSDISMCKFIKTFDNDKKQSNTNIFLENYSNIQALEGIYKSVEFVVPWNKLYKKHIINKFRYPLVYKYEDEFIIHKVLYECNKISCSNKELYYYYQREGSTMNSKFSIKDIDVVYLHLERIKFFESINEKNLKSKSISWFVGRYLEIYRKVKYILEDKQNTKILKKLIIKNYNYVLETNHLSVKYKLAILIFILNDKFYYSKIEKRDIYNINKKVGR